MEDTDFTNYNRIACLLIEIGTKVLRETVTNHIRHDMEQALNLKKSQFESLKRRQIISAANFDTLYPPNQGSLNERDVDIGLWLILARKLCPSSISTGVLSRGPVIWNGNMTSSGSGTCGTTSSICLPRIWRHMRSSSCLIAYREH